MSEKQILFGGFKFPILDGLEYLTDENKSNTDFMFINGPGDSFSMYFEKGFPIFSVPESSERPYCLFEIKRPERLIKFFCPEKLPNLNSVVWYFYVELFDEQGIAHSLPGQVRLGVDDLYYKLSRGKPKFIEVLENVRLSRKAIVS